MPATRSKEEQRDKSREDRAWWAAWGKQFGWELLDSTQRYRANFRIDATTTQEISHKTRDSIQAVLDRRSTRVLAGQPPLGAAARRGEGMAKLPGRR